MSLIAVSRRRYQNLLDDRLWNFQGANVLLAAVVVIGGGVLLWAVRNSGFRVDPCRTPSRVAALNRPARSPTEAYDGAVARRTTHRESTLSDAFGITRGAGDDWFDPKLHTDTELFVDPFLLFDSPDPRWSGVHDRLIEFFNEALMRTAAGMHNKGSVEYGRASAMLSFPEPPQFCLGYGESTIFGRGSARGLGRAMLGAAEKAIGAGITNINDFGELMLFGDGFGADRVSDMTCNVVMDLFIDYTNDVVARHAMETTPIVLPHVGFDFKRAKWHKARVELPLNPCWNPNTPVLLVPEAILDELPKMDGGAFWDWVYSNQNEQLRTDLGYLVTSKVNRTDIIAEARRRPQLVRKYGIAYAQRYRQRPAKPYDFATDPSFKVKKFDGAQQFARLVDFQQPADEADFCDFIHGLVNDFKWAVEDRGIWKSFWAGDRPFAEPRIQDLFHLGVLLSCRDRDIDVSPESNSGSGPVDFKFSAGWTRRSLVEVKFAKSSSYWKNLKKQPPAYLSSEGIECGHILVIQHEDAHCETAFVDRTDAVVAQLSADLGISYRAVFVDARKKQSASKRT